MGKIQIWEDGHSFYIESIVDAVTDKPYTGCRACSRMIAAGEVRCPHCGQEQADGSKTLQAQFKEGSNR